MKRVFVISWFFPPINSSEGLVAFKLLKESAFKHDVFTQKDNRLWSYNNSEHQLTSPNIKTIFAKQSDSFEEWIDECVEYFEKNHNKYDSIMSRSMPQESLIAALKIKDKFPDVKWIASFGDPIYNSPFNLASRESAPYKINASNFADVSIRYAFSPKRIIKDYIWQRGFKHTMNHESYLQKLEQDAFTLADVVIFNNPYQQRYMTGGKQTLAKQIVIPHTFDPSFYPKTKSKSKNSGRISIVYLGHLDAIRTPISFLRALTKLREYDKALYNKLEVSFYGNVDIWSKAEILDNHLYDVVSVKKPISYFESLAVMKDSDWNLLIDANLTPLIEDNVYFAAKIADYIGSGSSIFGVTMAKGASADILREVGGVVSSHSVEEIFMNLVDITRGQSAELNKKVANKYLNKETSKKYDALLKELGHIKRA